MNSPSRPQRSVWFVLALALFAAVAGGFLGMQLGEALGYAIARLVDRDIAELKDTLAPLPSGDYEIRYRVRRYM